MGQKYPLHFPCSFPVKVIGPNREDFTEAVTAIFAAHIGKDSEIHYGRHQSNGHKYLSITATFVARSKEQLDDLYQALQKEELVLLTL